MRMCMLNNRNSSRLCCQIALVLSPLVLGLGQVLLHQHCNHHHLTTVITIVISVAGITYNEIVIGWGSPTIPWG